MALEGLKNILSAAEKLRALPGSNGENVYAVMLEDAGGLDLLENLQNHSSEDVSSKAVEILSTFFEVRAPSGRSTDTTVVTPNIGPLQTLDQDLRPQQISLFEPTKMFKRPNIWCCYGIRARYPREQGSYSVTI